MFEHQFPSGQLFLPELAGVANHVSAAAMLLRDQFAHVGSRYAHSSALQAHSQDGEQSARQLQTAVVGALVTPIDREDFNEVAEQLIAVVSGIGRIDRLAEAIGIATTDQDAARLADLLAEAADALEGAAVSTFDVARALRFAGETRRLTVEADRAYETAIASKLDGRLGPLDALRWREIYVAIWTSVHACAGTATLFERIALKRT